MRNLFKQEDSDNSMEKSTYINSKGVNDLAPGTLQKLVLRGLFISLIITAGFFVSSLDNSRLALPLYLGVVAVGALFMRLAMAPKKHRP